MSMYNVQDSFFLMAFFVLCC